MRSRTETPTLLSMSPSYDVVWNAARTPEPGRLSIQPHAITFFGDESPLARVVPFDELFAVTLEAETDGQRGVRLDVCDATSIEIESDAPESMIGDLLAKLLARRARQERHGSSARRLQPAHSAGCPRVAPGLGL